MHHASVPDALGQRVRPASYRRRSRLRPGIVALYLLLTLGGLVTFLPFIWMLLSTFKPAYEVTVYPPIWVTSHPTMENIIYVWNHVNFKRYFLNSAFIAVVHTTLTLLTSSLVGFVLAKYEFWGRNALFMGILGTMMVPWPVTLIPNYQLMVWFHFLNTYWALIVPGLYSSFGIFLMRQFMHGLPSELLDAARIDGASEPFIYWRIVLPLSKPALAALGLLTFIGSWDSFVWPLIVLNNEDLYTLPLALGSFAGEFVTNSAAIMAGATISILPLVVLYVSLQRYFVSGIAMTGLKG